DYIHDLSELQSMLNKVMTKKFRNKFHDSFGRNYHFNWFCMDHIHYKENPRKRITGFHKIFELYQSKINEFNNTSDRIYWHYHPTNFLFKGHLFGMNYSFTNFHNEILARRIIDHCWFPVANRPGAHMERVDMNLWLEQWIPFDLANQNMENNTLLDKHESVYRIPGRMGDWRGATTDWEIYHPSFFNSAIKGNLKRYIARCLNINAKQGQITENEIEKAFINAKKNPVLMAYTNHDFRNLIKETETIVSMIRKVSQKFPDIKYRWSNPVEAFRACMNLDRTAAIKFNLEITEKFFKVYSDKPVWGIQPFLAIRTKNDCYYHDNFIVDSETSWTYPLDSHSFSLNNLSCIGFAANDATGNTTVCVYSARDNFTKPKVCIYNHGDWF
ncbi:hypothetical protein MHK_009562, partial [Candidatus Magnetomorum sp. HK-1]